MNKVILMGRLVRDPEVKYSQGSTPVAIARYTLAVSRRFKRDGEPEADFISCVALGKSGEFVEKFFKKGQMVSVVGRLQVRSWDDNDGTKRWSTEVVTEEHYFAESKNSNANMNNPSSSQSKAAQTPHSEAIDGFIPMPNVEDDDLPF